MLCWGYLLISPSVSFCVDAFYGQWHIVGSEHCEAAGVGGTTRAAGRSCHLDLTPSHIARELGGKVWNDTMPSYEDTLWDFPHTPNRAEVIIFLKAPSSHLYSLHPMLNQPFFRKATQKSHLNPSSVFPFSLLQYLQSTLTNTSNECVPLKTKKTQTKKSGNPKG